MITRVATEWHRATVYWLVSTGPVVLVSASQSESSLNLGSQSDGARTTKPSDELKSKFYTLNRRRHCDVSGAFKRACWWCALSAHRTCYRTAMWSFKDSRIIPVIIQWTLIAHGSPRRSAPSDSVIQLDRVCYCIGEKLWRDCLSEISRAFESRKRFRVSRDWMGSTANQRRWWSDAPEMHSFRLLGRICKDLRFQSLELSFQLKVSIIFRAVKGTSSTEFLFTESLRLKFTVNLCASSMRIPHTSKSYRNKKNYHRVLIIAKR